MTSIDRAAWQRIKARMAEPRTVTVFKGRSIGFTTGLLEEWAEQYDIEPRPEETDAEFRARCARRWQSVTVDAAGRPV